MSGDAHQDGLWHDTMRVGGQPGDLYATSVSCFILAIPNRYLPILQEGRIKEYQKGNSLSVPRTDVYGKLVSRGDAETRNRAGEWSPQR